MIRRHRSRNRVAAAVLALSAATLLTACGAGQDANTTVAYSPTNGAFGAVGPITVSNVVVVIDAGGAEVYGSLADNSGVPEALIGVAVSGADPVTLSDGVVLIDGNSAIQLGAGGTVRAFVHNLTIPVGHLVDVTLKFRDSGQITLTTLVQTLENLKAGA